MKYRVLIEETWTNIIVIQHDTQPSVPLKGQGNFVCPEKVNILNGQGAIAWCSAKSSVHFWGSHSVQVIPRRQIFVILLPLEVVGNHFLVQEELSRFSKLIWFLHWGIKGGVSCEGNSILVYVIWRQRLIKTELSPRKHSIPPVLWALTKKTQFDKLIRAIIFL
jgi:hypothetical protein